MVRRTDRALFLLRMMRSEGGGKCRSFLNYEVGNGISVVGMSDVLIRKNRLKNI